MNHFIKIGIPLLFFFLAMMSVKFEKSIEGLIAFLFYIMCAFISAKIIIKKYYQ